MDVLHSKTFDAEEDQLQERTKYSQMDKLLLPMEFQQAPVSTGVRWWWREENDRWTSVLLDNHHGCGIRWRSDHRSGYTNIIGVSEIHDCSECDRNDLCCIELSWWIATPINWRHWPIESFAFDQEVLPIHKPSLKLLRINWIFSRAYFLDRKNLLTVDVSSLSLI